jgi:hypothetical protein
MTGPLSMDAGAACNACLVNTGANGALACDPSNTTSCSFYGVNWAGCAALEDSANGVACAGAYTPWAECALAACGSNTACNTQALYDTCVQNADKTGGACATEDTALTAHCATDVADGGVLNGGKCSTALEVLQVICGTGP